MRKPFKKIRNSSDKRHLRRRLSIRNKISGDAERPRICAIRSNKHIQVQVVNDDLNKTLFAVQSFGKEKIGSNNKEGAKELGKRLADMLKKQSITKAVFDRHGTRYGAVVASLVNAMRENGIQI